MKDVLAVTGITGKSGSVFAEKLAEHYGNVTEKFPGGLRTLVRSSKKSEKLNDLLPQCERIIGILEDEEYLERALMGVDTLVHIAGIAWSEKIVRAAVKNHVRRLILVHTTGIYSKYKAAGEGYRNIERGIYESCRENGILLTILRPTMIYGCPEDMNVIKFIKMVDRLPVMPVVNGARYELQPVHYSDLGKAYFDVLMNEEATINKDFDLSGKKPILLREMLEEIGVNLGKKVVFVSVPYPIAYVGAVVLYGLTIGKIDYREKVQRLCEPRAYSHALASEAFGYDPMAFEHGIVAEVKAYKELSER